MSKLHELTERIRCPVHGFIRYSKAEKQIIDHPLFQRLRNIKQLALTSYVYPGALHSRFGHSLGVMEFATQAFDNLCKNHRRQIISVFSSIPEFKKDTIFKIRQLVRLLGLLHDIGHTPFSHAGEILAPGGRHENVTMSVLENEKYLGKLLDELFWEGISKNLKLLIDPVGNPPSQFILLKQLISYQMDLDRADYLIRDSIYCGVDYGRFDYRRLIQTLALTKENDKLQLAIDRGGFHVFEALILARYQMNTQVYYHSVRTIYDYYIDEFLKTLIKRKKLKQSVEEVLKFNDIDIMKKISEYASQKGSDNAVKCARRIWERRHHKLILEVGDHADAKDVEAFGEAFEVLHRQHPEVEFVKTSKSGSIHDLYVPGDDESTKAEELFVVDKNSKVRERITEKSKIMQSIPKKFRVMRVFADWKDNDKILAKEEFPDALRSKLMKKARRLFRDAKS